MNFTQYQEAAAQTASYKHPMYPVVSVGIEAAELCDLFVKPLLRGDDKAVVKEDIMSEAGDVLWNLCQVLTENKISFNEVAEMNLEKLQSRAKRGVIRGDGGDR